MILGKMIGDTADVAGGQIIGREADPQPAIDLKIEKRRHSPRSLSVKSVKPC